MRFRASAGPPCTFALIELLGPKPSPRPRRRNLVFVSSAGLSSPSSLFSPASTLTTTDGDNGRRTLCHSFSPQRPPLPHRDSLSLSTPSRAETGAATGRTPPYICIQLRTCLFERAADTLGFRVPVPLFFPHNIYPLVTAIYHAHFPR